MLWSAGVTQHGDDFVISVEKDPQADDKAADAEKDAVDD